MANFFSDTQTLPTRAMRETVLDAALGDEQRGQDPTTAALEARVAALLGKPAAVFLPSGSMCNEIALAVHCRPGDEVICEETCHILNAEAGGPAALAGVMVRPIAGRRGQMTPEQVAAAIRTPSRYDPLSRLLCVEQTANLSGGAVWPVAALDAVAETARAAGLATHMDGARLLNAAVASGEPAARHAQGYDSVWIDFSKGLGAPVGAAMAGSHAFIDQVWRLKQRWGGAMRQSGVLAAMALYALDHHVERLADDHALAARIGAALASLPGVVAVLPVESNIVIFDLADGAPDARRVVAEAAARGVDMGVFGDRRIRVVTHLDVGPGDADALMAALSASLG